ncbi:MAG TPA: hypothetical protein VGJ84_21015 [Polyangiaceae bacterium]
MTVSIASPATAKEQADPPKAHTIDVSTPAPEPAVQRSYHMHDGLYLRLSVGVGSLWSTFDDGVASNNIDGNGFTYALDALVGGSPSRGVAIGGALLTTSSIGIEFSRPGQPIARRNINLAVLGAFIDGFPNPADGWHLGGALGFARINVADNAVNGLTSTNGLAGAGWLGYDWWVGDEWSVGFLFRLLGGVTGGSEGTYNVSASALSATVMFAGLYN